MLSSEARGTIGSLDRIENGLGSRRVESDAPGLKGQMVSDFSYCLVLGLKALPLMISPFVRWRAMNPVPHVHVEGIALFLFLIPQLSLFFTL